MAPNFEEHAAASRAGFDRNNFAGNDAITPSSAQGLAAEKVMAQITEATVTSPDTEQLDLKLLQELLADLVFASGKQPDFTPLEYKIKRLEHQLYDPEEVIQLLLPVISELLNRKVVESKDSIIRAIVPIIDEVIVEKTQEDKVAMVKAIANLIPGAIDQQVRSNANDLIEALAPAMGEIIKQQIRVERDAMVDALYPVIGSTISKYMQEVVRDINARVESTLTPAGIQRKIRAKMQGISEAELIFQESMPFDIKAIFLIHKQSGLVIASTRRQNLDQSQVIEGDLMAGMLTAMRSFAAECAIGPGNTSELKEIEYESFHILMEVAGYCYIATVLQGQVEARYIQLMRETLGKIILEYDHDHSIRNYGGDPSKIHQAVQIELDELIEYQPNTMGKGGGFPVTLLLMLIVPLLACGGWFFWQGQRQQALNAIAAAINLELNVDPQLAVYPVASEADIIRGDRQIILGGKVPTERLKNKAETITLAEIQKLENPDGWQLVNEIVAVEIDPDPDKIAADVARLTTVLNQDRDVIISTTYGDREVRITGHLRTEKKLAQIQDHFSQIPGVENVLITSTSKAFPIDQRLYFATGAIALNPGDVATKLPSIQEFLLQYPLMKLQIVGHQHPKENPDANLSEQRAIAVRDSLVTLGIESTRLEIVAAPSSPANLTQADPDWLSRTVRFERIME